jgi:excisionase family DNA binding protein
VDSAPDPYRLLAEALDAVVRHAARHAVAEALAEVRMATEATMVSVPEAAHRLGLGRTKVNELIAAGELPSILVGKRRLLRPADLEAFAARQGNG